ncbi:unnamed protein product [Chrysoparadoxa australica]
MHASFIAVVVLHLLLHLLPCLAFKVVLLRHGESTWNAEDRYIGWTDVPLTAKGQSEAKQAGTKLREAGFCFDHVYCSMLKRALLTSWLVMDELGQHWIPESKRWQLNERFVGDLVGKTPTEARAAFGEENVKVWRGTYDVPPPPMSTASHLYPGAELRYEDVNAQGLMPTTECMVDVEKRVAKLWEDELVPRILKGERLLVCGHAVCLKALMRNIDGLDPDTVVPVSIPRATPIVYTFEATSPAAGTEASSRGLKPVWGSHSARPFSGEFLTHPGTDQDAELVVPEAEVNSY